MGTLGGLRLIFWSGDVTSYQEDILSATHNPTLSAAPRAPSISVFDRHLHLVDLDVLHWKILETHLLLGDRDSHRSASLHWGWVWKCLMDTNHPIAEPVRFKTHFCKPEIEVKTYYDWFEFEIVFFINFVKKLVYELWIFISLFGTRIKQSNHAFFIKRTQQVLMAVV